MLKRSSGMKRNSSLKQTSRLKNNKTLHAKTNLRSTSSLKAGSSLKQGGSKLESRSTLKQGSSLKTNTTLKQNSSLKANSTLKQGTKGLATNTPLKQGTTKLKVNSYKKTRPEQVASRTLAMPKKARIQNQAVIDACRRPTCEICGRPAGGEPHHIVSRGAGGPDMPENLIQLCRTCHTKAHSGELSNERILWAVSCRMKLSVEEIQRRVKEKRPW